MLLLQFVTVFMFKCMSSSTPVGLSHSDHSDVTRDRVAVSLHCYCMTHVKYSYFHFNMSLLMSVLRKVFVSAMSLCLLRALEPFQHWLPPLLLWNLSVTCLPLHGFPLLWLFFCWQLPGTAYISFSPSSCIFSSRPSSSLCGVPHLLLPSL